MNWDRARRQDGVSRWGSDVPHGNIEVPDWSSRPRGRWLEGEHLTVPTCDGTVSWARRLDSDLLHVQWTPPGRARKRIAHDRAEYFFYDARRQGMAIRTVGNSYVSDKSALADRERPLVGWGMGARWTVESREGLW